METALCAATLSSTNAVRATFPLVLICFCWIRKVRSGLMLVSSLGSGIYSSHELAPCSELLPPLPLDPRHGPIDSLPSGSHPASKMNTSGPLLLMDHQSCIDKYGRVSRSPDCPAMKGHNYGFASVRYCVSADLWQPSKLLPV